MKKPVKIILALTSLVLSQVGMAQDKTVNDGVFTAAQAATGKSVYDNSCKTCHDMRFYRDIRSGPLAGRPVTYWHLVMACCLSHCCVCGRPQVLPVPAVPSATMFHHI